MKNKHIVENELTEDGKVDCLTKELIRLQPDNKSVLKILVIIFKMVALRCAAIKNKQHIGGFLTGADEVQYVIGKNILTVVKEIKEFSCQQ